MHHLLISTILIIFFNSKIFKIIQNYSDLSHASSGAGNGGKCSESCFLVFLKEQGTGKQGPKGKEKEENRNSLKENATKSCRLKVPIEEDGERSRFPERACEGIGFVPMDGSDQWIVVGEDRFGEQ